MFLYLISQNLWVLLVSVIVNVASFCGYTDLNYVGLVELKKKYPNDLEVSETWSYFQNFNQHILNHKK